MTQILLNQHCILAIAPSAKGVGFAVLEGTEALVDWGVKTVIGKEKNVQSREKVKKLISQYQPQTLILEDTSAKGSRRSSRVRKLTKLLAEMASNQKVGTKLLSREQVMKTFIVEGKGTKHQLAEILAKRFPEQLALQLPPKREAYNAEDPRMSIFGAAALALAFRVKSANWRGMAKSASAGNVHSMD